MFEIVTSYKWPYDGIAFAGLRVRIDDLATRLGVIVQKWNEDGLGPASGFGFRSVTGRVYLLQELELAVEYYGATGPNIFVDAAELATVGTATLVEDVVATLGLAQSEVVIFADAGCEKIAAELVAKVTAERAKRGE